MQPPSLQYLSQISIIRTLVCRSSDCRERQLLIELLKANKGDEDLLILVTDLFPQELSDELLYILAPQYLRHLKLKGCSSLTCDGVVNTITRCSHLNYLDFSGCESLLRPSLYCCLKDNAPYITHLSFEDCEIITDDGVQIILMCCPGLEHLNISSCKNITDEAFALSSSKSSSKLSHRALLAGRKLSSVDLSGCQSLTSAAVKKLVYLCGPTLTSVNISWTGVGCTALLYLAGLSSQAAVQFVRDVDSSCLGVLTSETKNEDGENNQDNKDSSVGNSDENCDNLSSILKDRHTLNDTAENLPDYSVAGKQISKSKVSSNNSTKDGIDEESVFRTKEGDLKNCLGSCEIADCIDAKCLEENESSCKSLNSEEFEITTRTAGTSETERARSSITGECSNFEDSISQKHLHNYSKDNDSPGKENLEDNVLLELNKTQLASPLKKDTDSCHSVSFPTLGSPADRSTAADIQGPEREMSLEEEWMLAWQQIGDEDSCSDNDELFNNMWGDTYESSHVDSVSSAFDEAISCLTSALVNLESTDDEDNDSDDDVKDIKQLNRSFNKTNGSSSKSIDDDDDDGDDDDGEGNISKIINSPLAVSKEVDPVSCVPQDDSPVATTKVPNTVCTIFRGDEDDVDDGDKASLDDADDLFTDILNLQEWRSEDASSVLHGFNDAIVTLTTAMIDLIDSDDVDSGDSGGVGSVDGAGGGDDGVGGGDEGDNDGVGGVDGGGDDGVGVGGEDGGGDDGVGGRDEGGDDGVGGGDGGDDSFGVGVSGADGNGDDGVGGGGGGGGGDGDGDSGGDGGVSVGAGVVAVGGGGGGGGGGHGGGWGGGGDNDNGGGDVGHGHGEGDDDDAKYISADDCDNIDHKRIDGDNEDENDDAKYISVDDDDDDGKTNCDDHSKVTPLHDKYDTDEKQGNRPTLDFNDFSSIDLATGNNSDITDDTNSLHDEDPCKVESLNHITLEQINLAVLPQNGNETKSDICILDRSEVSVVSAKSSSSLKSTSNDIRGLQVEANSDILTSETSVPSCSGMNTIDVETASDEISKVGPEKSVESEDSLCKTKSEINSFPGVQNLTLSELNLAQFSQNGKAPSVLNLTYKPRLRSLDITNIYFHSKALGVACLKLFSALNRTLNNFAVSWSELDDDTLIAMLSNQPELRSLTVTDCEKVTNRSLISLPVHCPSLESIDLKGVAFITDQGVVPMLDNTCLKTLSLAEASVSDMSMFAIAEKCGEKLLDLDLSWCEDLTDKGICTVAESCTSLRSLALRQCSATRITMETLSVNCQAMTSLNIAGVDQLTDQVVASMVTNMPNLTFIDLSWNSGVTSIGVGALLSHCRRLEEAVLSGLKVLTSKPFLAIIGDLERWRTKQEIMLRRKLKNERTGGPKETYIKPCNMETAKILGEELPFRSLTYSPSLRNLVLEYSDKVNDDHLSQIVAVCRGTLSIRDYYGQPIEPMWIFL